MSTLSPQEFQKALVAAMKKAGLQGLARVTAVTAIWPLIEQQLTEAEARLASQQVELTDWILVADSVKHDWRCGHGELGTDLCLRCQLEKVQGEAAGMAGQGEQIAQLTKAIKQWEERDEILRQKVDDYQWDIGQLERQSTVLRQRTAELEAELAAVLTARDEAERRIETAQLFVAGASCGGGTVGEALLVIENILEGQTLKDAIVIAAEQVKSLPLKPTAEDIERTKQLFPNYIQPSDLSADPPKEQG